MQAVAVLRTIQKWKAPISCGELTKLRTLTHRSLTSGDIEMAAAEQTYASYTTRNVAYIQYLVRIW